MDGIQTTLLLAVAVVLAIFIWLAWQLHKMMMRLDRMQGLIRKIEAGAEKLRKSFGGTAGGPDRG